MPEQRTWDDDHVDGSERARTPGADPGAYIGHEPERSTETIPGGVGPADERVSAGASQAGAVAGGNAAPERGSAEATDRD